MELLLNADKFLFYFVNKTLANPLTDKLMPFITERDNWFIFYILIWIYLFFFGGRKGKVSAVLILILILITDQFSDNIVKPFIHRIRPCNELSGVHLLTGCTESFSFPSNHAVNNFAAAYMFSHFYPKVKYLLYIGALIVASSRVFCGVHYPSDIIGGAFIGIIFAFALIYVWNILNNRIHILK